MIEFSSPSLRTGRADFPHPALRLMVHLRRGGSANLRMGNRQGEQAMLGKESIGPAIMIETTTTPTTMMAPTQNATQSHADPRIQQRKRRPVTMSEVLKPSRQSPIHVRDDDRQATTIVP